MAYLPDAEQVFLGKCGLDNEELAALRERVRDSYKLVWTVQLGKKLTARTDDTTFMPVREHVCYFLDDDAYNLCYCVVLLLYTRFTQSMGWPLNCDNTAHRSSLTGGLYHVYSL
mgnify:FL=1